MAISSLFPVQVAVWLETIGPGSFERDLCINSPTGSGKTLAYALPIVQQLSTRKITCLRALVVLPTRDLALQAYTELLLLPSCGVILTFLSDIYRAYFRDGPLMLSQLSSISGKEGFWCYCSCCGSACWIGCWTVVYWRGDFNFDKEAEAWSGNVLWSWGFSDRTAKFCRYIGGHTRQADGSYKNYKGL